MSETIYKSEHSQGIPRGPETLPHQRYIVAQMGSRRNYAVASAFQDAGMLEALYTDLCGEIGFGRLINQIAGFSNAYQIKKLRERRIPADVLPKTRSFAVPALEYEFLRRFRPKNPYLQSWLLERFGNRAGNAMVRAGFGEATHLYTLLGDVTPLLARAREANITTVSEIYVILTGERIIAKERLRYPGFEVAPPSQLIDRAFSWLDKVCSLSDWFVCPSESVRDDLHTNFGVSRERCLLVPYSASDWCYNIENRPTPGRVLFPGTAGLRKGIHILGKAAANLKGRRYEFRVAGDVTDAVAKHPLTEQLSFLGRLLKSDMKLEYEQADAVVLPSLAEGSAEATYEALAAGIPIITTREAGSVVRDGVEGYIVPASDPDFLAVRIEELIENRELRARMSDAARKRAQEYTHSKYAERLTNALRVV